MNEIDLKSAEDILIIAVELCYEAKLFDWTVLNPINFIMITMLEHAQPYYERESVRLSQWLIKLYGKLGMMKLVQQNASNLKFKGKDDLNYMRLGAAKLSYFTDFGIHENLEDLLSEYKDFFRDRVNENKNAIVTSFIDRDF